MISSCVIDAAPWRVDVPRQSAPVSPPPMITTCLPSAVTWSSTSWPEGGPVGRRQELHRLEDPAELAPGRRQVARQGGAHGEHDRVVPVLELVGGEVLPHVHAGPEDRALAAHLVEPPVEVRPSPS